MLLYDSLWHPAKHAYNLEYIQKGLHCLESMVDADPILNARTSIRRMIGAVEQTIASRSSNHNNSSSNTAEAVNTIITTPGRLASDQASSIRHPQIATSPQAPPPPCSETTFTSAANDILYLSDRAHGQPSTAALQSQAQSQLQAQLLNSVNNTAAASSSFDPNAAMMGGDPMSLLDFDVLTTDLYSFFPIQTDRGVEDFGTR